MRTMMFVWFAAVLAGVGVLNTAPAYACYQCKPKVAQHTLLRVHARSFAAAILRCCPPGEDAAAALRKVREALMTANAAVALAGADSVQALSELR